MSEENLLHCPQLWRYCRRKIMLHEVLTQKIIGAAMAVLNELRPGLDEKRAKLADSPDPLDPPLLNP